MLRAKGGTLWGGDLPWSRTSLSFKALSVWWLGWSAQACWQPIISRYNIYHMVLGMYSAGSWYECSSSVCLKK